jgi:hypothetical protein
MLRNSTSKQRREDDLDDEYEEDNDEESALGFDDISKFDPENKERKKQLEIMARLDEEYEGEWGYALIKALRGKTVGRRLRRKLFKFGFIQLTCGFAMFIIAIQQSKNISFHLQVLNFDFSLSFKADNMRNVENFSEPLFGGASLTVRSPVNLTMQFNFIKIFLESDLVRWITFLCLWNGYDDYGLALGISCDKPPIIVQYYENLCIHWHRAFYHVYLVL